MEACRRLRSYACWVAYKGIQHDRRRGTYRSPAGLWGLAFGNEAKPNGLKMPWRDVTPNSEWVGDEDSHYFNTWQECDDPMITGDWDHTEGKHLEDYSTLYAYAVTVLYNIPPHTVPNRGCAIFLHCSEAGTEAVSACRVRICCASSAGSNRPTHRTFL